MADETREKKVQEAVAAVNDPTSSVTADAAQKQMVEESKNAGIAAFTFDPDATPEQKRAQARAVSEVSIKYPNHALQSLRRLLATPC